MGSPSLQEPRSLQCEIMAVASFVGVSLGPLIVYMLPVVFLAKCVLKINGGNKPNRQCTRELRKSFCQPQKGMAL